MASPVEKASSGSWGAPPSEIDKDFGGRRRSMRPRNIQLGKEGLDLCAILQILELLISGEGRVLVNKHWI